MSKINASEISEKAKARLRPTAYMGGSVFKNGKDVSKQIEKQTATKYAKSKALEGKKAIKKVI